MTDDANTADGVTEGSSGLVRPASRWLESLTNTWAFDILARAIYVGWFLYLSYYTYVGLIDYYGQHGSVVDPVFIATVLSRIAVLSFFATLIVFVIIRLRPVQKSQGPWPRLAAFFGTFILMMLPIFPAHDMSLAGKIASTTLIFTGNALSVCVMVWLGRSISIMPEARRLVTAGPYAIARHPLYVTEEISVVGIFMIYLSPWTLALFIFHAYLQLRRMAYEEEVLARAFPEYEDYARRTARLIPGIY